VLKSSAANPTTSAWNEAMETVDLLGDAAAVGELGASTITQGYGLPLAGLVSLLPVFLGAGPEVAEEVLQDITKALVYEPQTSKGKELAARAMWPFEKLHEISQNAGDWVLKKTSNPELAAIAATSVEGVPAVLGGMYALKKARAANAHKPPINPEKLSPESEFYKEQFDRTFLEQEGISVLEMEKSNLIDITDIRAAQKRREKMPRLDEIFEEVVSIIEEEQGVVLEDVKTKKARQARKKELMDEVTKMAEEEQGKSLIERIDEDNRIADRIVDALIIEEIDELKTRIKNGENPHDIPTNILFDEGIAFIEGMREKIPPRKKGDKVSLTPEESFVLRTEGPEGLKKAAKTRKENPETELYGGIPVEQFTNLWTNTVGTLFWDNLIETKLPKVVERIPGGKQVNRALLYDYRGDLPDTPLYMKSLESMKRHQAVGRVYAVDLGHRLVNLPERTQLAIGDFLRGQDIDLTPAQRTLAAEARNVLDVLGKQAVDVGLLDAETFFKNVGQYLPRLYTKKEYKSNLSRWGLTKPNRFTMSRFLKRKDIPPEIRKELGEIMTPAYPVAKGITQLTHDIQLAKFFNGIAANRKWSLIKEPVVDSMGRKVPYKQPDTYNPITGEKIPGKKGIRKDFLRDPPEGMG
jgi:hypothetical protein